MRFWGEIRLDGWTWAILFARWTLGLLLFVPGFHQAVDEGLLNHARASYVEAYPSEWIPTFALWTLGVVIPLVRLVAGAMLCIGIRVRGACISVGTALVLVTFLTLRQDPSAALDHITAQVLLLLFVLVAPRARDESSIDYWLSDHSRPPQ